MSVPIIVPCGSSLFADISPVAKQTARVWDRNAGETKMVLRGHEHVVECAEFAPVAAYASIRKLAGLTVSPCCLIRVAVYDR